MSIERYGKRNNQSDFVPLVSIIIPVFNGENYIEDAIKSAIAQTYQNIEIIVINDGSIDKTDFIVQNYRNKIRYYKKKNGGVASALNQGIKKAKGQYISWLSHDDLYKPNKIQSQIDLLSRQQKEFRSKTIVYGSYSHCDSLGKLIEEFNLHLLFSDEQLKSPLFVLFKTMIHGCTLLIPKKSFVDVSFFNEKLRCTQDYDLWYRLFPKYHLLYDKNNTVISRQHNMQSSRTISTAYIEGDQLWVRMFKSLSLNTMRFIGGDLVSFCKSSFNHMVMARHMNAAHYVSSLLYNRISNNKTSWEVPKQHNSYMFSCWRNISFNKGLLIVENLGYNAIEIRPLSCISNSSPQKKTSKYIKVGITDSKMNRVFPLVFFSLSAAYSDAISQPSLYKIYDLSPTISNCEISDYPLWIKSDIYENELSVIKKSKFYKVWRLINTYKDRLTSLYKSIY